MCEAGEWIEGEADGDPGDVVGRGREAFFDELVEGRLRALLALVGFGVVVDLAAPLGRGGSKEGRLRFGAEAVVVEGIVDDDCIRLERFTVRRNVTVVMCDARCETRR